MGNAQSACETSAGAQQQSRNRVSSNMAARTAPTPTQNQNVQIHNAAPQYKRAPALRPSDRKPTVAAVSQGRPSEGEFMKWTDDNKRELSKLRLRQRNSNNERRGQIFVDRR